MSSWDSYCEAGPREKTLSPCHLALALAVKSGYCLEVPWVPVPASQPCSVAKIKDPKSSDCVLGLWPILPLASSEYLAFFARTICFLVAFLFFVCLCLFVDFLFICLLPISWLLLGVKPQPRQLTWTLQSHPWNLSALLKDPTNIVCSVPFLGPCVVMLSFLLAIEVPAFICKSIQKWH